MPLPSYARVTNMGNGYSVIVRVNDRGPYAAGRVMDVSSRVADVLDFKRMGTAHVKVEYIGRAPLEGSDDNQLLSTLRTDGGPADIGGATMTAENAPPPDDPPAPTFTPPPVERPVPRERPAPVVAEPAQRPEADQVADSEETVAPRHASAPAPLPPARPYDLGVRQASFIPQPPVRPGAGDRALYLVEPPRPHDDPLARLLRHKAAHPDDE
jgi:rare lipoprotein A